MLPEIPVTTLFWLIPLTIWEVVWKGIALWKSARRNHLVWFVFILIVNSLGILPIVYLILYREKKKVRKTSRKRR
ncbi:hypothetical protein HY450_02920 [Candidatus Pacearchaeota archaeon]|nr:hypothetical protein [Candidatus Pacearchaeota archaeon]